jgi:hypothetical protein
MQCYTKLSPLLVINRLAMTATNEPRKQLLYCIAEYPMPLSEILHCWSPTPYLSMDSRRNIDPMLEK